MLVVVGSNWSFCCSGCHGLPCGVCSKWGDGLQLFLAVSSELVDLCLLEDVVLFRSVITDLNCSLSGPYSKWSSIMKSKYIFIPSRTSASKVGLVCV